MPVDGAAADVRAFGPDPQPKAFLHRIEDLDGLPHHLRPDAVAGQYSDFFITSFDFKIRRLLLS